MQTPEQIAAGLSERQVAAFSTLPLPRPAEPHRKIAARPYSSIWRKSSKFINEMYELAALQLVESTVSRGEILWRPTRPLGLTIRKIITQEAGGHE